MSQKSFFLVYKFFHLLDEPVLNLGDFVDFFYGCTFSQSFIHDEMTLAGRCDEHVKKLVFTKGIKILRMSQTVAAGLQASDCFLESFFVGFADTPVSYTHLDVYKRQGILIF